MKLIALLWALRGLKPKKKKKKTGKEPSGKGFYRTAAYLRRRKAEAAAAAVKKTVPTRRKKMGLIRKVRLGAKLFSAAAVAIPVISLTVKAVKLGRKLRE